MTQDELKTRAKEAAEAAKESGAEVLSQAKAKTTEAVRETASTMRDEAQRRAEDAKDSVADEGALLASSLKSAAADHEGTFQSRVLETIAEGISDASEGLRSRSLSSLMGEAEMFARRHPAAFIAGAAVTGFALARFARASDRAANAPQALPARSRAPSSGAGAPAAGERRAT